MPPIYIYICVCVHVCENISTDIPEGGVDECLVVGQLGLEAPEAGALLVVDFADLCVCVCVCVCSCVCE